MDVRRLKKWLELERLMGVDVLFRTAGAAQKLKQLEQEQVKGCTKCRLRQGRTQTVFGRGNPRADLMFIGEGPGADEDRLGEPFVGRAGKLLDKMVFAMGLERDEVYVTNIVKCRPPNNREPHADEVEACMPYLERQIELVQPAIICCLGLPASNAMLQCKRSMGELRGRWSFYRGIPLMPTYHPAYLLRSPSQKGKAWEDLRKIMIALKEGPPRQEGLF